jgi:hypothetical protein
MSFLDIALQHVARGFKVHPLVPSDKGPITPHGWHDATAEEAKIRAWWSKTPNANVGLACGPSGKAVLDVDYGLADEAAFHEWRIAAGLPETYTVRTGRRPGFGVQMYFNGPIPDVGIFELNGCSGQIKSAAGYVLAAGCLHPSGHHYEVLCDVPFADTPDVVRNLKKPGVVTVASSKVPKTAWSLPVHASENRTGFLLEQTGAMRNLGCGKDAILARMIELNDDPDIIADPVDGERLERTAENCAKYPVPEPGPVILIGGRRHDAVEPELEVAEKSVAPVFPDESWDGTVFGAFADIVCRGNDIPRKFASEPFRIITGSIVGNQISCGIAGVRMRDYGVIIGPPQSGKSVGLEDAEQFYDTSDNPLLFHYKSEYRPCGIGAQKFLPGSGNSFVDQLQREENERTAALIRKNKKKADAAIEIEINDVPTQWSPSARYITIQGEAMALLARFGNDWTGQALASNLTDLYDGESTEVPITKERASKIKVKLQYAMLLCTQPHIWRKYVAESLVDSGLFGRFYIVGSERAVRQEQLPDYAFPETFEQDFGALRRDVFARILYLADHPLKMTVSPEARQRLSDWEKEQATLTPVDRIDRSRLGLHVWRAAMARAWGWMPIRTEITLEDADAAIRLGEYQVKMRQFYAPTGGDDRDATVIQTVRHTVRMVGQLTMRDLKLKVHADRMGKRFDTALDYLVRKNEITLLPGRRKDQQIVAWVRPQLIPQNPAQV